LLVVFFGVFIGVIGFFLFEDFFVIFAQFRFWRIGGFVREERLE
jgi:hypothetical protein